MVGVHSSAGRRHFLPSRWTRARAGALVAVVQMLSVVAPTHAAAMAQPAESVIVPAEGVWEDLPFTVRGAAPGAASVVLWARQAIVATGTPGPWTELGTVVVGPDGFQVQVTWPVPGALELAGVVDDGAALPPEVPQAVAQVGDRTLSLEVSPGPYKVLTTRPTARVSVIPAIAGVQVTLSSGRDVVQVVTDGSGRAAWVMPALNTEAVLQVRASSGAEAAVEASVVRSLRPTVALQPRVRRVRGKQLPSSWHRGCPVGPDRLRNVVMVFQGYDGVYRWGEMVMHRRVVDRAIRVFRRALTSGFRIRRMEWIEAYQGSDPRSMEADNSYAFACRQVTGDPFSLSPHSYGTSFDLNPRRNPYQDSSGKWWPANGLRYRDRSLREIGMIFKRSVIRLEFAARGFFWGGFWRHRDYQHFQPR